MRFVIDYDTDAQTAEVVIGDKVQRWSDARLTLGQGITETRDGYLIRRERDGSKSLLLTGQLTGTQP
ncbi:hypothetical protein H9643_08220 [Ochrobactrum sp. Sa2BUA5]|nr:hypothetical protein [Ochrobactrum gallinarum]